MRPTILNYIKASLLVTAIFFIGCDTAPSTPGVWKDKDIPAGKAEKLHQLNTDLFKAIKTDIDDAELLLSKEYLEQKNIKVQFDHINKLRKDDEYVLLKDYYIVNKGDADNLKAADSIELAYKPLAKEMYIACFIPKNKLDKTMLTIVYANYDIGWKANSIVLGYYTQQGKTSTELYELAKKDYAQGYLVNAINNIIMAQNCLSGSAYIRAANRHEIVEFAKRLMDEANSKFNYPLTISGVKTNPKIFTVSSNAKEGEFTQYIYYLTKLKLTDTAAVRKENDEIKQHIAGIFPGIDKGKKTMYYSAMNQKPIVGKSIDHLDFEEKINN